MRIAIRILGCVLWLNTFSTAHGAIELDGRSFEVVDMHLHSGKIGDMNSAGKAFIVGMLPPFAALYFPAFSAMTSNPYAPYLGTTAQLEWAQVDYGVILATYTHHSVGFLPNHDLEKLLTDPRNTNGEGQKKFWGMASINLDNFDDTLLAQRRVAALNSYFEKRPDLFIGIKLAHAHQGIEFDDPNLLPVYDVAATYQTPVLLHTGKTPFPGAVNEPHYYDPISLESIVMNYNGVDGNPRVEFVLSHVGRGDVRSAQHALYLAEQYENVWLELSALGGTFQIDAEGNEMEHSEPMYFWVLDEIKRRNLVERSLFATDGPQSSGKIREYTNQIVQALVATHFTHDEIEKILSGNFFDCFFGGRP